jgi:alpha-1,3-rhamnosyl/mannosyltransferase
VALPADLIDPPAGTGHSNMWRHVLRELKGQVDLRPTQPGRRPRRLWRPDVWLYEGTRGALSAEIPTVVQVHEAGWGTDDLKATMDPRFLEYIDRKIASAVGAAAGVITPSESARQQVIDRYGIGSSRVHAVYHGVDSQLFRPGLPGGAKLVASAGGRSDLPYVLFVSILHPRKNLSVLRDAVTGLARRGYPHQLVIVAAPPPDRADYETLERSAFADLPGTSGRVVRVVAPTDTQLAALMAGAAVFCLPSLMEGFGMAVLEAMACGTPVVVSNRGSLPEVVGEAGVVVEPSAVAVEAALARLLDEPSRSAALRGAGRKRAVTFTWSNTAAGWLSVLESAVSVSNGRP